VFAVLRVWLCFATSGGGGFYTDGAYSGSDGGNSIAGANCGGYRFLKIFEEEMHFCHCKSAGAGRAFVNGGAGGASASSTACWAYTSSPGGFGGGAGAGYAAAGPGGGYSGGGGYVKRCLGR
jgi:hypothetical protein